MFGFHPRRSNRDIINSCTPDLISNEEYIEIYNRFTNLGIETVRINEESKVEESVSINDNEFKSIV